MRPISTDTYYDLQRQLNREADNPEGFGREPEITPDNDSLLQEVEL